jgi:ATP/maltotriose-dependent transcriptional regulator MalT
VSLSREDRELGAALLLIVDNVHEVRGAEAAAELLAYVVAIIPESHELILSGRAAAPLREVDRRVASGEVVLLGKDDLAFSEEEIACLATKMGCDLDPVEALRATNGWPVAVTAMTSGVVANVQPGKLETSAAWERYLAGEIWEGLPADMQEILLPLSVCELVEDALAQELLGDDRYARLQEWIGEHDFLIDLHAEGSFELNPILRQFIRNRFSRRDPKGFRSMLAQATEWMERRGAIAEAIELARTLDKGATLAQLLERHSRRLLYQGAFALLWRGFEVLPPEQLEDRPELGAIRARVLSHTGKPNQALEQAEEVLSHATASPAARVHALLARERGYRLLGRVAELPAVFGEIDEILERTTGRVLAEVYYAEANYEIQAVSNFARGDELLHRSILNAHRTTFPNLEPTARSTLGN